jgi:hypothetical protein
VREPNDQVMVNLDPIRSRLGREFMPFTIHLSDGRSLPIPARDFIAVGRGVVSVIDDRDVTHTLVALHIFSIEDALPHPKSNGT